jgi:hypothetical protein
VTGMAREFLEDFMHKVKHIASSDKYRFYPPYLLHDILDVKVAGRPFYDDVKTIKSMFREEVKRYNRYYAFLDAYINKHADPIVDSPEDATYRIRLLRNLLN